MLKSLNILWILSTLLITFSCSVQQRRKHKDITSGIIEQVNNVADSTEVSTDSVKNSNNNYSDSLTENRTTIQTDSISKKNYLDDPVNYQAMDSVVFYTSKKMLYLYDSAKINYQAIQLEANFIQIDLNKKELSSAGSVDSSGIIQGKPIFTDNGKTFTAKEIAYNFDSKRGWIAEAITNEGEAYLHAGIAKKDSSNILYVKNAKFTTCIDPEPHFHIMATKAKIIQDEAIFTGPANLQIANIPTPLVVPFGYFPTKKTKSSGLILPEYGELAQYGFFLRNLGYYFSINDYIDLTITGDIYTSLSFGARAQMNYKKRYQYNGSIGLGFSQLQYGDPAIAKDFRQNRDFKFTWNHTQDPKSNPTITFNASVNIVSGSFNTFNASNVTGIVQNQFQSNISFSKTFRGTPVSISANIRHSQNTQTRQVNISLPDVVLNVTRFFPFKRKKQIGSPKWYENIGVSYTMNLRNDINTIDTLLVKDFTGVLRDMNNGIQQRMSVSTNMKILKHITFNPSVNYTEKWHFANLNKFYDPISAMVESDTIRGFFSTREFNASASLTTMVYGMYSFKKGPIKAIRHVMTPTINANFRPDLGDQRTGYFGPNGEIVTYSPNQIGLFGSSPSGLSGTVGFNINNNIEMKVASKKDTITGMKKIPLLEVLSLGMNYDFARDSLNLSNLNIAGRTTLFNLIGINFSMSFDPYTYRINNGIASRVNTLLIQDGGGLMRLTQAGLNVNFTLRGESKRKDSDAPGMTTAQQMVANQPDYYNYVDFNIPYSFSLGYNIVYAKPLDKESLTHALNIAADVNITKKWKVSMNLNYDIQNNKITTSQFNIYRDLHCWEMRVSVIPFGIRQSYMFTINVKSPLLQMLKLQRQSGWANLQ